MKTQAELDLLLQELEAEHPTIHPENWLHPFEEAAATAEAALTHSLEALAGLGQAAQGGSGHLHTQLSLVRNQHHQGIGAFHHHQQQLEEGAGTLSQTLGELAHLATSLQGNLHQQVGEVGSLLGGLIDSLNPEELRNVAHLSQGALAGWLGDLRGPQEQLLQTAFGLMLDVSNHTAHEGEQHLERIGTQAGGMLQQFGQQAVELAHLDAEQIGQRLEQTSLHLGQSVLGEVQRSLLRIGTEGLEVVGAEIAEHLSLAAVGVEVTGALAPILPELVAAKLLLGAINEVLESAGVEDDGY